MEKMTSGANYILVALIPRLEELKPGLTRELIDGINVDKEAIAKSGGMNPEVEEVFQSASDILSFASKE